MDIGCGKTPRNPYQQADVWGIDIAPPAGDERLVKANLALESIPFADSYFDSVSAYDFLEHVPRVLPTADFKSTRFPYIELMNEVWRVLRPGGLFYASTPVFPHEATFVDPTHVNVLTVHAHSYFTRPHRSAAMYGFIGDFVTRSVHTDNPTEATLYLKPRPRPFWAKVKRRLRRTPSYDTHVIWEFEAVKPADEPRLR
ncbi:MAG TPA: class I SAM-dependent methyltransferase [Rubrivivax sp.]|nr:class I SAM-dependent methyltransferase [Rubrivivax sp.]